MIGRSSLLKLFTIIEFFFAVFILKKGKKRGKIEVIFKLDFVIMFSENINDNFILPD